METINILYHGSSNSGKKTLLKGILHNCPSNDVYEIVKKKKKNDAKNTDGILIYNDKNDNFIVVPNDIPYRIYNLENSIKKINDGNKIAVDENNASLTEQCETDQSNKWDNMTQCVENVIEIINIIILVFDLDISQNVLDKFMEYYGKILKERNEIYLHIVINKCDDISIINNITMFANRHNKDKYDSIICKISKHLNEHSHNYKVTPLSANNIFVLNSIKYHYCDDIDENVLDDVIISECGKSLMTKLESSKDKIAHLKSFVKSVDRYNICMNNNGFTSLRNNIQYEIDKKYVDMLYNNLTSYINKQLNVKDMTRIEFYKFLKVTLQKMDLLKTLSDEVNDKYDIIHRIMTLVIDGNITNYTANNYDDIIIEINNISELNTKNTSINKLLIESKNKIKQDLIMMHNTSSLRITSISQLNMILENDIQSKSVILKLENYFINSDDNVVDKMKHLCAILNKIYENEHKNSDICEIIHKSIVVYFVSCFNVNELVYLYNLMNNDALKNIKFNILLNIINDKNKADDIKYYNIKEFINVDKCYNKLIKLFSNMQIIDEQKKKSLKNNKKYESESDCGYSQEEETITEELEKTKNKVKK